MQGISVSQLAMCFVLTESGRGREYSNIVRSTGNGKGNAYVAPGKAGQYTFSIRHFSQDLYAAIRCDC